MAALETALSLLRSQTEEHDELVEKAAREALAPL